MQVFLVKKFRRFAFSLYCYVYQQIIVSIDVQLSKKIG